MKGPEIMEEPWAKVAELGKWLRSYKAEYRAKLDKAEEEATKAGGQMTPLCHYHGGRLMGIDKIASKLLELFGLEALMPPDQEFEADEQPEFKPCPACSMGFAGCSCKGTGFDLAEHGCLGCGDDRRVCGCEFGIEFTITQKTPQPAQSTEGDNEDEFQYPGSTEPCPARDRSRSKGGFGNQNPGGPSAIGRQVGSEISPLSHPDPGTDRPPADQHQNHPDQPGIPGDDSLQEHGQIRKTPNPGSKTKATENLSPQTPANDHAATRDLDQNERSDEPGDRWGESGLFAGSNQYSEATGNPARVSGTTTCPGQLEIDPNQPANCGDHPVHRKPRSSFLRRRAEETIQEIKLMFQRNPDQEKIAIIEIEHLRLEVLEALRNGLLKIKTKVSSRPHYGDFQNNWLVDLHCSDGSIQTIQSRLVCNFIRLVELQYRLGQPGWLLNQIVYFEIGKPV